MMKATPPKMPLKAALMAALALMITIGGLLWAQAITSPRVAANQPAAPNLDTNNPAIIVPPPTVTPIQVGSLLTATPGNPAAPPATSNQHGNADNHSGEHEKGNSKDKGQHKP